MPLISAIEPYFTAFLHTGMLQHPFSKCSVASWTASAADRDAREARLQQASQELDNGLHDSIRKAAAANDVPAATLRHWRQGRPPKVEAQNDQQHLTPTEETGLLEYIRRCACSGYPLTPALLRDCANEIIRSVPGRSQEPEVSHAWLQSFLLRHLAIRLHWSRCLDNARLNGANETVVREWFARLAEIMREFSAASTNVFNMDETGFMLSQAGSKQVVVPASEPAARFKAQPGTLELAMVIKCIGSSGQVLLPLIITKGHVHTVGEQWRLVGVPASWRFAKTVNSWMNHQISLEWLETIFEPNTRLSTRSEYCLLIIDGHKSHTSEGFLDICWNRNIVPFLLLAHATHVMQPLDVSIFGLLTASYRRLVSDAAEHMDAIDKPMFGTWPQAPLQELTGSAANSAFNAAIAVLAQEQDPREAQKLAHSTTHAHAQMAAALAASKVESNLFRVELERRSKSSTKRDPTALTTVMITRADAERNLVAKGPYKPGKSGGKQREEEEEEEEVEEEAAVSDRDDAFDDGNEALLASARTPSPPPTHSLLDELDDGKPLSAIDDDDPTGFGFFDTLPQAGPSHTQH
ncbi:related to transposase [Sporisorium reilianum SRZ2]|uniref:Related to transposase n=1 Tax=Sporisorium reilianum (strain SRZ2) TaxID=999809 RepID=E7A3G0_SPORE|nr:related to transposase [Sporisorium reilianum SRZ2]